MNPSLKALILASLAASASHALPALQSRSGSNTVFTISVQSTNGSNVLYTRSIPLACGSCWNECGLSQLISPSSHPACLQNCEIYIPPCDADIAISSKRGGVIEGNGAPASIADDDGAPLSKRSGSGVNNGAPASVADDDDVGLLSKRVEEPKLMDPDPDDDPNGRADGSSGGDGWGFSSDTSGGETTVHGSVHVGTVGDHPVTWDTDVTVRCPNGQCEVNQATTGPAIHF